MDGEGRLVWTITIDRPGSMVQQGWAISSGNVLALAEMVSDANLEATVNVTGWARIRASFKGGVRIADRDRIDEFYTGMSEEQQRQWTACWACDRAPAA